jgi:transposase
MLRRPREPRQYTSIRFSEDLQLAGIAPSIGTVGDAYGNAHFGRHPDAEIHASQPGLGTILAARVLGEFGDRPHRDLDAKAPKTYAGTAPITRASGTRTVVLAR